MSQTRAERIRNIGRAARDLGVTRQHLRHVLAGRRVSVRLSRAYRAWIAERQEVAELNTKRIRIGRRAA